ncbi:MAG: ATP-binding protein [Desulfococcaceae bacterium]
MGGQIIRLIIDSDIKKVYLIAAAVEALCNHLSLSDDTVFGVRLSVTEAVNNCIIHAYGNETGHEVEVILAMDAERVMLKVCDTGLPMNPDILSDSPAGEFSDDVESIEDAKISGRGLSIIKKLMDTVSYNTEGRKNCLVMTNRKIR